MGNWFNSLSVAYRVIIVLGFVLFLVMLAWGIGVSRKNRKRRAKEANLEAFGKESVREPTAKELDEGGNFSARSSNSTPAPLSEQVHEQADADQIGIARSVSRKVPTPVVSARRPPSDRTNDPTVNISSAQPPSPPLPSHPRSPKPNPGSDVVQPSYPLATFQASQRRLETPTAHDPTFSPPQFVVTSETSTTGPQESTHLSTANSVSSPGTQRDSVVSVTGRDDQRTVSPISLPSPRDRNASPPISPSSFPAVPQSNYRNGIFYESTPPSLSPFHGNDTQLLLNPSRTEQGGESTRTSVGEWAAETVREIEQSLDSRDGSISASSVYSTDLTHRNRGERLSSTPWTSRPSSAVDSGLAPPGSQRQSNASIAPSAYSHSHLSSQFGELYDAYYRQSGQSMQSKMDEADDRGVPGVETWSSKNPRNLTLAEYTIEEVPTPLSSPMRQPNNMI